MYFIMYFDSYKFVDIVNKFHDKNIIFSRPGTLLLHISLSITFEILLEKLKIKKKIR